MRCWIGLGLLMLAGAMSAAEFPPPHELPDGSLQGVPVAGEMGIVRSVADIQAMQEYRDRNRLPRVPRRSAEHEIKRFPRTPPNDWLVAQWPPLADGAEPPSTRAPQTVGPPNFTAAVLSDTSAFPPDTMGAVGPTQFIAALNGRIRSFNKTTGAADNALNADSDVFFNTVISPQAGTFTTDPRIRFDRLTNRWFIVMIDVPAGTGAIANRVMIAVSSGPNITGSANFTFFQYQQDSTLFADYPTLGIDANALYIGLNMFSLAGAFNSTAVSVVRKSSITGSGSIVVTRFPNIGTASAAGPFTPQGVDNYDSAASVGYFVGVDTLNFGILQLRRVSNPGTTPTLSANITLTVPATQFPAAVVAQGSATPVDSLDDRLFAAHLRGGQLWTAHNIAVNASGVAVAPTTAGARTATRWYQIGNLGTTPTLTQSGTIFDNASSNPQAFWIPSVMVSGQGHAAFGFSAASLATRIDAATTGRLSSDAAGTTRAPIVRYTSASQTYAPPGDGGNPRRWGDYSYTSLDPCDDMTMWTIQQFTNATHSYGVQAVRLQPPAPTLASCGAPTSVSVGASNVNVVLTGTGLFDTDNSAGACRTRLAAAIGGTGMTVNSVSATSATSATLNLSVAANATLGPRTITLTNPDGQSANTNNCLSIVGPEVLALTRSSTNSTCTNTAIEWGLQLSSAVTGLAASNFSLSGSSAGTIGAVNGSGSTRTIGVTTGSSTGTLTLSLANSGGVTPALTGLPFAGEAYQVNSRPNVLPATPPLLCSGGTTNIALGSSPAGSTFAWTLGSTAGVAGASAGSGGTIAQALTGAGNVQYLVTATRQGCSTASPTTITQSVSNPAIATASVPRGVVGAPYPTTTLTGTGLIGPGGYDVFAGALPVGLQLSTAGVISGTPTQLQTVNPTIRISDGSCSSTRALLFEIVADDLFANGFE